MAMDFSQQREEVRQKYKHCVLKTPRAERHAGRERFRTDDSVLKLLASTKLSDRLHFAIIQVMDELTDDWQPEQVAAAFDAMETYAVNLLEYPWKKEFHTILLYSGFYKTQLEPNLHEPHILLSIIGYERVPDDRLFLVNGVPLQAVLTDAAIDFFLAATECRIISSVISQVEHATPVEVYWMRRANIGDEQVCVDALTLSRRPLPLDSEKPPSYEIAEVDKHARKFNADVEKRGGSPYDNVADDSKPQYGILMHTSSAHGSDVLPSHTGSLPAEAKLPKPFVPTFPTFRQPSDVTRQVKSPLSNVGTTFQRRSPEAPPPVYAAAKDMPSAGSAQLQNILHRQDDEVDALAALLKNVDPHVMENAAHRQQIMSQLENYSSSSSSGSGMAELPPKFVGRRMQTNAADDVRTGWQCQHCTYYNENSTALCEICNNKKT